MSTLFTWLGDQDREAFSSKPKWGTNPKYALRKGIYFGGGFNQLGK